MESTKLAPTTQDFEAKRQAFLRLEYFAETYSSREKLHY